MKHHALALLFFLLVVQCILFGCIFGLTTIKMLILVGFYKIMAFMLRLLKSQKNLLFAWLDKLANVWQVFLCSHHIFQLLFKAFESQGNPSTKDIVNRFVSFKIPILLKSFFIHSCYMQIVSLSLTACCLPFPFLFFSPHSIIPRINK